MVISLCATAMIAFFLARGLPGRRTLDYVGGGRVSAGTVGAHAGARRPRTARLQVLVVFANFPVMAFTDPWSPDTYRSTMSAALGWGPTAGVGADSETIAAEARGPSTGDLDQHVPLRSKGAIISSTLASISAIMSCRWSRCSRCSRHWMPADRQSSPPAPAPLQSWPASAPWPDWPAPPGAFPVDQRLDHRRADGWPASMPPSRS